MIVIAPANNKGGVGKTKLSILLAEYFSCFCNKRVLAIDFDPQCNFSQRFLKMEVDPVSPQGLIPPLHPDYAADAPEDIDWDGRSTIADIFYGEPVIPYPTFLKQLDIAPGHADRLLNAEAVRRSELADKVHYQLDNFLSLAEVQDAYDVVVIDTAPSKGPLTTSVFRAASHIIIPSLMEEQPIQGIYGMLQLWMQESKRRHAEKPLRLIGILPNMYRPINLHKGMYESLLKNSALSKYMLPVKLAQRAAFAEVDAEEATPRSIFDLPETNIARQEALAVCEYIAEEIFEHA